ncbi:MAG: DUF2892 domain-containing protein [Capnocytophaga sp.]|nr:DUF2892 domain-containing protein [Capnocytophaga sp.]
MKINIGKTDRTLRIALAMALAVLAYFNIGGTTLSIVFLVLAVVMLVTALFRFCPLYTLFGFTSCPLDKK